MEDSEKRRRTEWQDAAQKICAEPGICLLWGATDTGKSTLAAFLLNYALNSGRKAAVVDADLGQSDVGPPGVIGLGIPGAAVGSLKELQAEAFFFIGSTSPQDLETASAAGTRLMVSTALQKGAEVVVVDTTGAVFGRSSRVLKMFKYELVRPKYLLLLQRRAEGEHLIKPLEGREETSIIRLPVPAGVRRRSLMERRELRQESFARYFSRAVSQTVPLEGVAFSSSLFKTGQTCNQNEKTFFSEQLQCSVQHAERIPEGLYIIFNGFYQKEGMFALKERLGTKKKVFLANETAFQNLLVGLRDGRGRDIEIGILEGIDFQSGQLHIYTLPGTADRVKEICVGRLKVSREGKEIGFDSGLACL